VIFIAQTVTRSNNPSDPMPIDLLHRFFTFVIARLHNDAPVSSRKETKFIEQLFTGDPTAWVQLVDRWSPRLYSYLIYNAVSEAEVHQLMRRIFSEVVQAVAGSLRVVNLAILIFSIAHHHILHYRHQNSEITLKKQQQLVPSAVGGTDQRTNFLHCFHQLAPEAQQVLLLHYLCEISLSEITQIVGQSEELLAKILYQAKLSLP
jgi:DNA-directed RNA polymerase specialized sigma24 family protein